MRGVRVPSAAFRVFSILVLANATILLLQNNISFDALQSALKISLPVYVMYYARRHLTNERMLDGIIMTILISASVPALMLLWEVVVGPINVEMSRGLQRYTGFYADSLNYSMYLVFVGIALFYRLISSSFKSKRWRNIAFVAYCIYAVLTLISINHIATYAAVFSIVVLYLFFKKHSPLVLVVGIVGLLVVVVLADDQAIIDRLSEEALVSNEIEILEGTRSESQAFHGRMTRWLYIYDRWADANIIAQLFGGSFDENVSASPGLFTVVAHNDYLRIMVSAGVIGLFAYIIFMITSLAKSFEESGAGLRFIYVSTVIVTIVYSISTVPTIYPGYVMISYAITARLYK